MNFRIVFSGSVMSVLGILIGNAWRLSIPLDSMDVLKVAFILLMHGSFFCVFHIIHNIFVIFILMILRILHYIYSKVFTFLVLYVRLFKKIYLLIWETISERENIYIHIFIFHMYLLYDFALWSILSDTAVAIPAHF